MGTAAKRADLLAVEVISVGGCEGAVPGCCETAERPIERPGRLAFAERLGCEAERGDDDIAFVARKRRKQIGEGHDLDFAADAQFRAQGIGEFDIETGEPIGVIAIMKGREAIIDENADRAANRFGPLGLGVDKAKRRHGIDGLGVLC